MRNSINLKTCFFQNPNPNHGDYYIRWLIMENILHKQASLLYIRILGACWNK